MSLYSNLPAAILDTILGRLACLFLTGAAGDTIAARHAAGRMLAAYRPQTENELRLAAEIISFSFHALDALAQAADPDLSLSRKLRLRGSAVSLSRESHKSQRKLDQSQKASQAKTLAQPVETPTLQPDPVQHRTETAPAPSETTREAFATGRKHGGQTWTQGYQQRLSAKRIADNLKRNQASAALQITPTVAAQSAVAG
jgi:hypothetical protein